MLSSQWLAKVLLGIPLIKLFALKGKKGALTQLAFFQKTFGQWNSDLHLPWLSYGAIDYLGQTVPTDASVLELGGGSSTIWWATRGNTVITVESDEGWAEAIVANCKSPNLRKVLLLPEISSQSLEDNLSEAFDLIVIDHSGDRMAVVDFVKSHLKPNGTLVLDNSDRANYRELVSILRTQFRGSLSFFGLAPGLHYAIETMIFSDLLDPPSGEGIPRRPIDY